MINITDEQWGVLINIIGAVESGSQIYGQRDYSNYTEAYTNSSAENSITIGAFQEFNSLARDLLREISIKHPSVFQTYDTADVSSDLKLSSWNGYNPPNGSAKAKAIQAIISTPEGRAVQDERILRQMKDYAEYGYSLGVTEPDALFEICNFCHQGGKGSAKRILSKTNRPYTLYNLYQATLSDTGNQVGAYRSRQKFVYNALKEHMAMCNADYCEFEVDEAASVRRSAADWMINLARDDSHGYDQIYRWGERGDYDCSSAVITSYKQAGVPLTCTYTGNMKQDMLRHGFQDVTRDVNRNTGGGMIVGDVLLNEVHHTAMYIGDGQEVEASINEKGGATGGKPGDQTGREILIRSYRNYPWDCVLRYVGSGEITITLRIGDSGELVRQAQDLLNANGAHLVVDGEFGKLTLGAVMDFQTRHLLEVDGIIGKNTWYSLRHQVWKVKKTPGVLRKEPRKASKKVERLQAGTEVRVYEEVYNELQEKWCRVTDGWIIANNLIL